MGSYADCFVTETKYSNQFINFSELVYLKTVPGRYVLVRKPIGILWWKNIAGAIKFPPALFQMTPFY
jgi:hypothetical protein